MNDKDVFKNPCPICKKRPATKLCDYVTVYDRGITFYRKREDFIKGNLQENKYSTCDLPLCDDCAISVGTNADMCPHHFKLQQQADLPEHFKKYVLRYYARVLKEQ